MKDVNLKELAKLKDWDRDDFLALVGLETRRDTMDWVAPTLTAFSVGLLVGTGLGLILAPKPGRELRQDLRTRVGGGADFEEPAPRAL